LAESYYRIVVKVKNNLAQRNSSPSWPNTFDGSCIAGGRSVPETRPLMKPRRSRKENFSFLLESDPASKREILRAALALFVRDGASDPTVRQIAARAGYSNPAIFKYFRTKDELALSVFKQCFERVTGAFHEAIHLDQSFRENLRALLRAYRRIVEEDLDAFLYTTENTRRFRASLSRRLRERSVGRLLAKVLENGKAEGVVGLDSDTGLLVAGVVGLLSQFARLLYFGEIQGPAEKWIVSLERMILRMCA
jgi:TetR/AcrR family transcriptional regulator, repressor of fatR-cypB operon